MAKVAILVVNYFSADAVRQLLTSLESRSEGVDLRVIVVDNSCDDDEWAALSAVTGASALGPDLVQPVRSASNLGYAGGNNLAYESCRQWRPDVVLIINPDVTVAEGSLAAASQQVCANEQTIFGARTLGADGSVGGLWAMRRWDGKTSELEFGGAPVKGSQIAYPSGHLIAISASTWEKLAGFSEDFFLFSEEVDLVLRAAGHGVGVDLLESLAVGHEAGLTTGSSASLTSRSITTYFHGSRSRVLLYRKHRSLKRCLVSAFAARLAWSFWVQLRVGRSAGAAVRRGMRSALHAPLTDGGSLG